MSRGLILIAIKTLIPRPIVKEVALAETISADLLAANLSGMY
jgi:hypothetical protein